MSDEQKQTVANETIRNAVAEKLAEVGKASVRQAVIDKMVEDEVASRTNKVLDGLNRLSKMKSDLRKLKPDNKQLDDQGNIVSETYSPARYEELKKQREKIAKLEKALELALDKEDYSKLNESGSGE